MLALAGWGLHEGSAPSTHAPAALQWENVSRDAWRGRQFGNENVQHDFPSSRWSSCRLLTLTLLLCMMGVRQREQLTFIASIITSSSLSRGFITRKKSLFYHFSLFVRKKGECWRLGQLFQKTLCSSSKKAEASGVFFFFFFLRLTGHTRRSTLTRLCLWTSGHLEKYRLNPNMGFTFLLAAWNRGEKKK